MSDDLARTLREAGHADIAEALERDQLRDQLREAGRGDLADAPEAAGSGQPAEPAPAAPANANQREAEVIVGALREAGAWPHDEAA